MEEIDNFDIEIDQNIQLLGHRRKERNMRKRKDPYSEMNDNIFKANFRFSKENVNRLTDLLKPFLPDLDNRGTPIPTKTQILITLMTYAGANFQRVSAACFGVSQNGARQCILRVTDAICRIKPMFVHLPSDDSKARTAAMMEEQFKLKNFVQNLQLCGFQQVQIAELISLFFLILNGLCSSAGGGTYSQTLHIN